MASIWQVICIRFLAVAVVIVPPSWTLTDCHGQIFFNDAQSNSVFSVNYDGTNVTPLATGLSTDGGKRLQSFTLDPPSNSLYYWVGDRLTHTTEGEGIYRRNLVSGATTRIVATPVDSGGFRELLEVTSMRIAPDRTKIYYGAIESFNLHRSNLDGSQFETAFDLVSNDAYVFSIDFDQRHNRVVWSQEYADGGETGIRSGTDGQTLSQSITTEFADSLSIDDRTGDIYFTAFDRIRRLNASGVEDVLTGVQRPIKIQVHEDRGEIYWIESYGMETNRIRAARIDGSGVRDILTGVHATDLYIVGVPEPHGTLLALVGLGILTGVGRKLGFRHLAP